MPERSVQAPLRVVHIDSGREWRGGERQLQLLVRGQRQQGLEPLVVVQPRSPLYRHLKAEGVAVVAIRMRGAWDLLAIRRIRRLLATWRPALVHAHDPRGHSLALTALVGRRNRIPLVVTRRTLLRPRGLVRFGPLVARFIALSRDVRDALVLGRVPPSRIVVIAPGIATPTRAAPGVIPDGRLLTPLGHGRVVAPRDWRAERGWDAKSVIVGIAGTATVADARATRELERLVRALAPNTLKRARFVILGGPSEGATRIGTAETFRAGFVHDLPAALAGLDLLILPGPAEGLGTAAVEAMALGVPPVAYASGTIGELIEPRRNGLLAPAGDVRAFAREVDRLVVDRALRELLGSAGAARAGDFAPERFVAAVQDVYREVLEPSRVLGDDSG